MKSPARAIWRKNLLIWAALLALLALTFGLAHVRLGAFSVAVGLGIAGIKAALVLVIFMELRRSGALTALAAGTGVFWLGIMLTLTLADVLTR